MCATQCVAGIAVTGIRLLLPLLLLLPACCPDALYELTTAAPQVRLPADEAPHCFGGGEWWYYTGELHTDDGRGFGVETVIFHVPRLPFLASIGDVWFAHYSVLDETTGEFVYDQTRGRGHLAGSCGVPAGGRLRAVYAAHSDDGQRCSGHGEIRGRAGGRPRC